MSREYEYFDLHEFNRNEKWGQEKEEDTMDQPEKTTTAARPKPYNPHQSPYILKPLVTEEDIAERAAYYDREWEARSGATRLRWDKARMTPIQRDIRTALKIVAVILVGVILAWASL